MRTELNRAAATASQGSSAELDSLRSAIRQQEKALREQEQRNAEIAQQMRSRTDTKDLLPMIAKESGPAIAIVTSMFCLHPSGQCNAQSPDTMAQPVWEDGTGFAITAGGYLVTNRHVVTLEGHRAQQVQVTLNNQMYPDQTLRADVIVVVPPDGPDLAVLKIRSYRGPVIPKIDWTGTHAVQGEPAAALGFPAGMEAAIERESRKVSITMSRGIFAKVGSDRLRFDGFTIPGSSGSPVFNGDGEVVAVHFAGQAGEERRGLGSAVPIRLLVPYLPAEAKAELGLR
jgi:S1-C subfamily serine protease